MYYHEVHKNWFANPDLELFNWSLSQLAALPSGARVLDVGCGQGAFLRYLHRQRPDLALVGLELAELEETDGVSFVAEDVRTYRPSQPYDAVVSLSVIEHLPDPQEFSRRLFDLCGQGGMVIVTTPDDQSILYALGRLSKRFGIGLLFDRLYSFHHLNHFSRTSLSRCLSDVGFHVSTVFGHDAPIAAIDLPVSQPLVAAVLRWGLRVIFALGRWLDRTYLQTQLARRV